MLRRMSLLVGLAGLAMVGCTKSSQPDGPIPVSTPRVAGSAAFEAAPVIIWANADALALSRGLEPKALATAERLSWSRGDDPYTILALAEALDTPAPERVALLLDARLRSADLLRILVTLVRLDVTDFDFILGWPPTKDRTLTVARAGPVAYELSPLDPDAPLHDMSGPGVLRLHLSASRVRVTTKHGQAGQIVPVLVDGDSCELPQAGAHAALERVAAELCEVKPEGFHLLIELDQATPFADVVALFADDPRPERCRHGVFLESLDPPERVSCEGAYAPEAITMAPWPPRFALQGH